MSLKKLKSAFPISWKNTLKAGLVFVTANLLGLVLKPVSENDTHILMIFILCITVISYITDGYFYGIVGSVLSVIFVNYFFTYPYMAFNFSLQGYPLTFAVMLTVSICICTLTTRLKKQERLRIEGEKELIRANLLRAISHDLRTPLTSIAGSTGAILDNYDALSHETKRNLLSEVREDAQWLIHMVENILSITRIGTDPSNANIVKHPEAVEEIVSEALSKFKKQYPGTAVSVRVPKELLMVPMDAMLIEQVLLNIMENAVIHGDTTSEILISIYRREHEAVFEVQDNGKGIPPEIFPRLFKEYMPESVRQHNDGKRNMGIGLSVCTSIIKAHGGTLNAENLSDTGGTKFCFTLPMEDQ